MSEREIIQDYKHHFVGEREVVNWTRPDGRTYINVPVMYLRQVTRDDFVANHPEKAVYAEAVSFWEVSID